MDKLNEIENKVNELVSKYRDIVNVGYEELDKTWKELDEYRKQAHQVFQDYDSSLHRDESGRFTQESYNIAELAAIATKLNNIDDKCYDEVYRLHVESQRKHDLYNQKNAERRTLNLTNKMYGLQIKKLTNRNQQLDDLIAKNEKYPELVSMYQEEKKANEDLIETYKNSMVLFDERLANFQKELDALKNGGEYAFDEVEETEEVNKNMEEEPSKTNEEENKNLGIVGQVKDNDFKDGFKPVKDDDFKEGFEEERGEEDDDELEAPVKPLVGALPGKDDEKEDIQAEEMPGEPTDPDEEDEDEELVGPEKPLVGALPGDNEEKEEEMPDEPTDPDEEEKKEDEEAVVAPVLVEETAQPKPTLFQKIKNIVYKAILVLGGLSATTLAVDHFMNHHDMATVEEGVTEEDLEDVKDDIEEDQKPEQEAPEQEQPSAPSNPGGSTGGNPGGSTGGNTGGNTGGDNGGNTGGDNGGNTGDTDEEERDPIQEDNTTFPIELGAGEVAYNYETGVEVTQDGTAYLHEEDGSVINQEDRELDVTDHGTSVVVEEDLYPDLNSPEQTFDEQIAAVPETGEEQTYTEAVESGELTQGEMDNLDAAFDALESYFNEDYIMQQ